jgi:hypothetical protein
MDSIWWAVIIGLVIGAVISAVFGVFSKKDAEKASRTFLGMSSSSLVTNAIVIVVVGGFVFLSLLAVFVKDLDYPVKSPVKFTIETILMAGLPSSLIFLMTNFRGKKITSSTVQEFFVLFAKFGVLHILLQFSGVYTNLIMG